MIFDDCIIAGNAAGVPPGRFIANEIDLLTLKRLATRDDGHVIGEWQEEHSAGA